MIKIKLKVKVRHLNALALLASSVILVFTNANLALLWLLIFVPSWAATSLLSGNKESALETMLLSNALCFMLITLSSLISKIFKLNQLAAIMLYIAFLLTILAVLNRLRSNAKIRLFAWNLELELGLLASLFIIIIANFISVTIPRTYLPDETSYAFTTQLFEAENAILAVNFPITSELSKFFNSKILWSGYLSAIRFLLKLSPSNLYSSTLILLSMMYFLVMLFLKEIFNIRETGRALILSFLINLSPTVFLWSTRILPDVFDSYFILASLYFLLKSIKYESSDLLFLKYLIIGLFLAAMQAVLIRANMITTALTFLTVLIYTYLRVGQSKKGNVFIIVLLYKLFFSILFLYLAIDIAYAFSVHILRNLDLAIFFRKFLFLNISLTEIFMGLFISGLPGRRPLVSYNIYEILDKLNYALTPEMNGLLAAAVPFFPMVSLFLGRDMENRPTRILVLISSLSFWIYFLNLVTSDHFHDINRYCIHLYILFEMVAIREVHRVLAGESSASGMALLIIGSFVPFLLNHVVAAEFGGTSYFWLMERYASSNVILLSEFLVWMTALLAFYTSKSRRKGQLSNTHLIWISTIFLLFSLIFAKVAIEKSEAGSVMFTSRDIVLLDLADKINNSYSNATPIFILSNFYIYIRNYLDVKKFVVLPMPLSIDEFYEMTRIMPDNLMIVITSDSYLSYHSVLNNYLNSLTDFDRTTLPNGVNLSRIYFTQWKNYKYVILKREMHEEQTEALGIVSKVALSWVWKNRSCVLSFSSFDNATNKIFVISTLKFSKILKNGETFQDFPYFDQKLNMDISPYVCYFVQVVDLRGAKLYGFSIVESIELLSILGASFLFLMLLVLHFTVPEERAKNFL